MVSNNFEAKAVPEVQGDEILNFGSEQCGGFLVANFLSIFPGKNRLKICHRKLRHILHCKKRNLSSSPNFVSESFLKTP